MFFTNIIMLQTDLIKELLLHVCERERHVLENEDQWVREPLVIWSQFNANFPSSTQSSQHNEGVQSLFIDLPFSERPI